MSRDTPWGTPDGGRRDALRSFQQRQCLQNKVTDIRDSGNIKFKVHTTLKQLINFTRRRHAVL